MYVVVRDHDVLGLVREKERERERQGEREREIERGRASGNAFLLLQES